MEKSDVELDIDLETYFKLNEAAREKKMLLDDFIEEILRKYIDKNEDNINGEK